MKNPLLAPIAVTLLVATIYIMTEILDGGVNSILNDQESKQIGFVEIWYQPNGEISTIIIKL